MKCPHCLVAYSPQWWVQVISGDVESTQHVQHGTWKIKSTACPECRKVCVWLGLGPGNDASWMRDVRMIRPAGASREPLGHDVPEAFKEDYLEAVAVFVDSPKASAALSRRCLQLIIREKAGIKRKDLAQEIEALIESHALPSDLSEAIDGVRNIGNFAAHPIKSTSTGEIVPVEPGEAEWLLDTLEGLFDFYFVRPAALQRKKDALNKKLVDAGKPPMK